MEIRQLRYFYTLCKYMSFTTASQHLGITQPNLTSQVKKLESECHTLLLNRTNPMSLTKAGELLFKKSEKILLELDNIKLEIADQSCSNERIKIGIPTLLSEVLVKKLTNDNLDMFSVSLVEDSCENLSKMLNMRELNFCIMPSSNGIELYSGKFVKFAKDRSNLKSNALKLLASKDIQLSQGIADKVDFYTDQISTIKYLLNKDYNCICPDILDLSDFSSPLNYKADFSLNLVWNKEMYITNTMGLFVDELQRSF